MVAMVKGDFSRLLEPGINKIFGDYSRFPTEYSQIFEVLRSSKAREYDQNMHGMGQAVVQPEGTAVQYDSFGQGPNKVYEHVAYGIGFIITHQAMVDNLYMDQMQRGAKHCALSMMTTKENVAANVLNRAFNGSYTGWDGLELCSASHLLSKGGTMSNKLATPMALSEVALEQILINLGSMVDDAGMPVAAKGQKIVVPQALEFEVQRILKSELQYNTADNAINVIKSGRYLPQGYVVNHYLTSTSAYFVLTDVEDGLKLFQREDLIIKNDSDFDTDNLKYKAYERYSVGWSDFRQVYGSAGV